MARAITATCEIAMEKVADLLGGKAVINRPFSTPLEAHEMIELGLPVGSLTSLVRRFPVIGSTENLRKLFGLSMRSLQRREKDIAIVRLNREQSGALFKVAQIVAEVIDVFGSTEAAQRFLEEPVMALNRARPVDLLTTPAGITLVDRHLARLSLGVFT